jgi:hypothetical protein
MFDIPTESNSQQQPVAEPESSSGNMFSDQLNTIKNEQGAPKYDSVDKALQALAHSQAYIPDLETKLSAKDKELEELRLELAKRQGIEETVQRLTAQREEQRTPSAPQINEQDIDSLVNQALQRQQATTVAQQNLESVQSHLTSAYGEKAQEVIQTKAKELNMTPQAIGELAKSNPKLVLQLFGKAQSTTPTLTTSSVNINPLLPQEQPKVGRPERSLLAGASAKEKSEFMKKIREEVYADYGVKQ